MLSAYLGRHFRHKFCCHGLFVNLNVPSLILRSVFNPWRACLSNHLPPGVLHMMTSVGIPLDSRFHQRQDERRERSRPQSRSIGDGTRSDCSEEYPPNSWSTEADVVLAELKYFRCPLVVYVLDSAFLSSR